MVVFVEILVVVFIVVVIIIIIIIIIRHESFIPHQSEYRK